MSRALDTVHVILGTLYHCPRNQLYSNILRVNIVCHAIYYYLVRPIIFKRYGDFNHNIDFKFCHSFSAFKWCLVCRKHNPITIRVKCWVYRSLYVCLLSFLIFICIEWQRLILGIRCNKCKFTLQIQSFSCWILRCNVGHNSISNTTVRK